MQINLAFLAEWEHEAAQTRKMLEKVPTDKLEWRPHPKSMTLGHLAFHLGSAVDYFVPAIFETDNFQWSGYKQPEPESTQDILDMFDKANAKMKHALQHAKPEDFVVMWTFGPKEKPFMQLPRGAAVRAFLISHSIHHRGQLSVYLRLLDVPVPGMYGPSADEKM
jgi:uncharacterized damage-inducible protein DinB